MTEHRSRPRAPRDPERQRDGLDAIGAGLAQAIPLEYDVAATRPSRAAARDEAGEDVSVRIAVAIARMEERQIAIQDQHRAAQAAADARHGQVVSMLATFVPRNEIEVAHKRLADDAAAGDARLREDVEALEERVKAIESRAWKLIAWAFGAIASAALTAIGSLLGIRIKPAG